MICAHLQEFLTSAIAKRPVLLDDRVRHGDASIAKWWRDEGEQEFVAAIHEKKHGRITGWLNNLPTTSVTAGTSSETRVLETLGAIATDGTPCELNAEVLQANCKRCRTRTRSVERYSVSIEPRYGFLLIGTARSPPLGGCQTLSIPFTAPAARGKMDANRIAGVCGNDDHVAGLLAVLDSYHIKARMCPHGAYL